MNYLSSLVSLLLKNPINQRNPRLKVRPKGLYSFAFYILIFNFSPCLRALCDYKSVKICVNPWLINYLRSTKDYVRNYKPFFAKRTQIRKSQVNVNNVLAKDYDNWTLGQLGKTNPKRTQTNPKRTQLKPIKCQNKAN